MLLGGVSKFWKGFFRAIALSLIVVMLAQDIAHANPSPGIFQHAVLKAFDQAAESPVIQGKKVQLDSSSGKILRTFKGRHAAPVFLIQDAHYHLEAQENASAAILQLIDKFDIRSIGVEGASGELWHDWATRYPDKKSREAAFRFWLSRHEIGAAEYAAAYAGKPVRLSGLEDEKLYAAHLAVNREILTKRENMEKRLAEWRRVLRALLSQAMPSEYINHAAAVGTGDITGELKQILVQAQSQNVDLKAYPQVEVYAQIEPSMEKLNGALLMREMRAIQAVDVRAGLLQLALKSSPEAIALVEKKMQARGFALRSPSIMSWLNMLKLTAGLNENMLAEFKALDRDLRRSYLKTDEQVWLDSLSRWTDLMESWQKLEWTPEDAAFYESEHARFLNSEVSARIKSVLKKYAVEKDFGGWESLFEEKSWNPWFQFYLLALQRDAKLAENTERLLKQAGGKPVLIYAGGFHTPGLERDLRNHSISFVTIRPSVKREQERAERAAYEQAIEGNSGFFGKILKNSMLAAQRSKSVPFELQTPRKFPALAGNISGEPAAFVLGASAVLTALSAASSQPVSLTGSDMLPRSRGLWESFTVSHRHVQPNSGTLEMSAELGSAGVRWKKSSEPFGGSWMAFGNIGIQVTAALSSDAVKETSQPAFISQAQSLGTFLPSELAEGMPQPKSIKRKAAVSKPYVVRSEIRKDVPVKHRSSLRSILVVILLGVILGPISAFAEGVKTALSPAAELKAAVHAIETSKSNIGPGTSRKIKSHAPEWKLVERFQKAYLQMTGNPQALGPNGADGTWGYEGSFTDKAMTEVQKAIAEGKMESLAPAVTAPGAVTVPSGDFRPSSPSSDEIVVQDFQKAAEPLMQQAGAALKTLSASSEASPLSAGVKEQVDSTGAKLKALKLFLDAEKKKGLPAAKQVIAAAQAKLAAYVAQFSDLQETIAAQAAADAALKMAQQQKAALDALNGKINQALANAESAVNAAENLIQPGQEPSESDLAAAASFHEVIARAGSDIRTARQQAPEIIKPEAVLAANAAEEKISGFLDRAGRVETELKQTLEKAKPASNLPQESPEKQGSLLSSLTEKVSEMAWPLFFKVLQFGPYILMALGALGVLGLALNMLRKRFQKSRSQAADLQLSPANQLTKKDKAFLRGLPPLNKAKLMYYPDLMKILGRMQMYAEAHDHVLLHNMPFDESQSYADYTEALIKITEDKQNELVPSTIWIVPVLLEAVLAAAFFYFLGVGLMPILAVLVSIHAAWTLTSLQNEWGHVVVAAFKGEKLTLRNLLGGHSFFTVMLSFIPLMPVLNLSKTKFENAEPFMGLIQKAGWFAGGILTVASVYAVYVLQSLGMLMLLNLYALSGTGILVLMFAFYSDFINPPQEENCALCGNVTLLKRVIDKFGSAMSEEDAELLAQMLTITAQRGGQAAGINAIVLDEKNEWRAVLFRRVASRLEFIPKVVVQLAKIGLKKYKAGATVLLQTHLRFSTVVGGQNRRETHPHPGKKETVKQWYKTAQGWKSRIVEYVNTITHNGDYDNMVKPNGKRPDLKTFGLTENKYTFKQMRVIIQYLLNEANMTEGDSPAIAMTMDLLHAQGIWSKSFLYAYIHALPNFNVLFADGKIPEKFVPNSPNYIGWKAADREALASQWEAEWAKRSSSKDVSEEETAKMLQAFLAGKAGEILRGKIPADKTTDFVKNSIQGFFHQDIYAALKEFLEHAEGSFALVVTNPLFPNRTAVGARYQPLSIGYDYDENTNEARLAVASESAALKAKTKSGKGFRERIDLDMYGGEIFEVGISDQGKPWIRGYSFNQKKELNEEELRKDERIINRDNNPYMSKFPVLADQAEWVKDDLSEVSRHLGLIDASFDDVNSFNNQTVRALAGFLKEKFIGKHIASVLRASGGDISSRSEEEFVRERVTELMRRLPRNGMSDLQYLDSQIGNIVEAVLARRREQASKTKRPTLSGPRLIADTKPSESLDFVIYGEENSYETAKILAQSLGQAFNIRVRAVTGTDMIESLKRTTPRLDEKGRRLINEIVIPDEAGSPLRVTRSTIAIGISHSGQNFSTALVTATLRKMLGNRVFALTGEIDTRMAVAIGQGLGAKSKWQGRVFASFPNPNFPSLHPSEASTLVAVAQQHAAAHITLGLIRNIRESFPALPEVMSMRWSKEQINQMSKRLKELSIEKVPMVTATDKDGKKIASAKHDEIKKKFRVLEKIFMEPLVTWVGGFLYIMLTTTALKLGAAWAVYLLPSTYIAMLGTSVIFALPAAVVFGLNYVFLAFTLAVLWRAANRIDIFRRLGTPALLIADNSSHVFYPVAQAAIKYWSLSPALTDPGAQYRAQAKGDLANIFAPLVKRGNAVMIQGLTDERRPDGADSYLTGRVGASQVKGIEAHPWSWLRYFENYIKRTSSYVLAVSHSSQQHGSTDAAISIGSEEVENLSVADSFIEGLLRQTDVLPKNAAALFADPPEKNKQIVIKLRATLETMHSAGDMNEIKLQEELVNAVSEIFGLNDEQKSHIDDYVRVFIQHKLHYLMFYARHVDALHRAVTMMTGLYYTVNRIAALPFYGWPIGQTQNRTKINTTASSVTAVGLQPVLDKIEDIEPINQVAQRYEGELSFRDYNDRLDNAHRMIEIQEREKKYPISRVRPRRDQVPEFYRPQPSLSAPSRTPVPASPAQQTVSSAPVQSALANTILNLGERLLEQPDDLDAINRWLTSHDARFEGKQVPVQAVERYIELKSALLQIVEKAAGRPEVRTEKRSELRNLSQALSQEEAVNAAIEQARLQSLLVQASGVDRELAGLAQASGWVVFTNAGSDEADVIRMLSRLAPNQKIMMFFDSSAAAGQIDDMKARLKGVSIASWVSGGISLDKVREARGWTIDEIVQIQASHAMDELPAAKRIELKASLLLQGPRVKVYGRGQAMKGVRQTTMVDWFETLLASRSLQASA